MKYSVTIQWSEEDRCYVAFLPEFKNVCQPVTHGDTYAEAAENAQEVLEMLIEEGEPLPNPRTWHSNNRVA